MPSLNFQKQFAAAVESGEKRQTIRKRRKLPFKVGGILYLYTGMRTKNCRLLGLAFCRGIETVRIHRIGNGVPFPTVGDNDEWWPADLRVQQLPEPPA